MLYSQEYVDDLLTRADKKSQKKCIDILLGRNDIEEAIELYIQAAGYYKIFNMWSQAANLFEKAGHIKGDDAECYVSASECYRTSYKLEPAIRCINIAIQIYEKIGRFDAMIRSHVLLGDLYKENNDLDSAVKAYQVAVQGTDKKYTANQYRLKIAEIYISFKQYNEAGDAFELLLIATVNDQYARYKSADYLFKCVVCKLYIDVILAKRVLEKYTTQLSDTQEYTVCHKLISALSEYDNETFTDIIKTYHASKPLDTWLLSLLYRVCCSDVENSLC